MFRRILIALLFAAAIAAVDLPRAEAIPISRNNPFRTYNLGGVNYGSEQWERARRAKSGGSTQRPVRRPSRLFYRGR